jgi:hypothetical protein
MDLNYLFRRQQIERSRAQTASSDAARQAHEELAACYERQIKEQTAGEITFESDAAPNRSDCV